MDLFSWLALERIPRVGPLTLEKLINAFGTPEAVLLAGISELRHKAGISQKLAETISLAKPPEKEISREIKTIEKLGIKVITRWDEDYPKNLSTIYDPPALLFVRGTLIPEDDKAIGLVGTRNPTRYGLDMSKNITRDLVLAEITVVSGMARGIDTECHKAALSHGGRTIAVLGCGSDVIYPKENNDLADQIKSSGAVVTEFRPGTPPLATNFYRRNRIISGLSKGVVVIEAALNSGSLITAAHALEQNRDVYAVPGSVLNMRSSGPHSLIKQGAGLVESAADIIEGSFASTSNPIQIGFLKALDTEKLSADQRLIFETVELDPIPIDVICEALNMNAAKVTAELFELEMSGYVRRHPGNTFSRSA